MKLSKGEFKDLVKECLLEILQEGLTGGAPKARVNEHRELPRKPQVNQAELQRRRALAEAVKINAGGDPVMQSLLADTAANTLPRMMESESRTQRPVGQDAISQLVDKATPDQLFGDDTVSKWAELAFSAPMKRHE